jgi:hypothetical protein
VTTIVAEAAASARTGRPGVEALGVSRARAGPENKTPPHRGRPHRRRIIMMVRGRSPLPGGRGRTRAGRPEPGEGLLVGLIELLRSTGSSRLAAVERKAWEAGVKQVPGGSHGPRVAPLASTYKVRTRRCPFWWGVWTFQRSSTAATASSRNGNENF